MIEFDAFVSRLTDATLPGIEVSPDATSHISVTSCAFAGQRPLLAGDAQRVLCLAASAGISPRPTRSPAPREDSRLARGESSGLRQPAVWKGHIHRQEGELGGDVRAKSQNEPLKLGCDAVCKVPEADRH